MSVKAEYKEDKLILELDNGDFAKFKEAMEKWDFKDDQSMIRFCISILLLSEDKQISIKWDGKKTPISPQPSILKEKRNTDESEF